MHFPILFRVVSSALQQLYDCPSDSEAPNNKCKYNYMDLLTWSRIDNIYHNKTNHMHILWDILQTLINWNDPYIMAALHKHQDILNHRQLDC